MGLHKSWSDLATKQQNQHHFWEQILPQLSLWVCWRLFEILKIFLATSAVYSGFLNLLQKGSEVQKNKTNGSVLKIHLILLRIIMIKVQNSWF